MLPNNIMLAEDFGPLYTMFAAVCMLPAVGAAAGIFLASRRPRLSFGFGLTSAIVGALLVLMLAVTEGGALPMFWFASFLPLIIGISCLVRWAFRK